MYSINKNILVKAALIAALTLSAIIFFSAESVYAQPGQLKAYKLMVSYPLVRDKGDLTILKDTVSIFYWQDYLIYKVHYTALTRINDGPVNSEKRYNYFVFKKADKYGHLFYDVLDSSVGKRLPVDSFLFVRGFHLAVNTDSLKLVSSKKNKTSGVLLEKYVSPKQRGDFVPDSIFYYYSPHLKTDYTFSAQLDSIKNMKLYEVRFMYNRRYSRANKITLPKREFYFEVIEVVVDDKKEIEKVIKRFEEINAL